MNLMQTIPAGIGWLCLAACVKSARNTLQKYDMASLRNYAYIVSGSGIMEHTKSDSRVPVTEGDMLDLRQFQSAGHTIAIPDTSSVFWIAFNMNQGGNDFTVTKLPSGTSSVDGGNKAAVVCVSGELSINGVDIPEGKFAYVPADKTSSVEASDDILAFVLTEIA